MSGVAWKKIDENAFRTVAGSEIKATAWRVHNEWFLRVYGDNVSPRMGPFRTFDEAADHAECDEVDS